MEVVDAELSKYFDMIPHRELLRQVKRRVSDGSILKLIRAWLRAPIVEEDSKNGKKRNLPNKRGTPQGGVISPLLANIYLNELDHAVNEKCELKPIMVRYADDLVILCYRGQGPKLKERLNNYLKAKGLELNDEKTKVVDTMKESLTFVGFRINWRRGWKSGKRYPHIEPSPQAIKKLHTKVYDILNHWTTYREMTEVVHEVNQVVRGWSEYFHYGHSGKIFARTQDWLEKRLIRWLWRKRQSRSNVWERKSANLGIALGLYKLPLKQRYDPKGKTKNDIRKAVCGKSACTV
jgi:RNA-directed DNA polymerase